MGTIEQQDLLKRVDMLEQQVRALQSKVDELEQVKVMNAEVATSSILQPQPTVKIAKARKYDAAQTIATADPQQIPKTDVVPKKQSKTFEQWIAMILPKVFILIFVLGVLWGLKVASDYGYFNHGMKVVLGYVGSIALFAIAFWMEKKQKGSMQVALMLYGGAFVVGILTTAAGAILYEVLGLYVALLIAFIYIAYGVAISYVNGSESLTALVVLTSFLLPYLLEYMNFNSFIIVAYIVLLFGVVQLVIMKHQQKYALYVGTFLSVLALVITAVTTTNEHVIYPLAIALVAAIFLAVILKLFAKMSAKHNIHAGFIFSYLMYIVLAINIAIPDKTAAYVSLALLITAYGGCAFAAKKAGHRALFDVVLSAAFIAFITVTFYFNTSYTVDILLALVTVAFGLLLAIRLRIPFMQLVYSFLFGIVSLIVVANGDIQPFWSVEHLTFILVAVAIGLLYRQLRKAIEEPSRFEVWREKLHVIEWVPIALYVVALVYSMQLQDAYLQSYSMSYLMLLLIVGALVMTVFVLPIQKHVPLMIVSAFVFTMAYIVLATSPIAPAGEAFVGIVIRLLYSIVVVYALYNFMQRGIVQEKLMKSPVDVTWIVGTMAILVGIFSITNFMALNDLAPWNFKVIVNTIAIFGAAAVSLFVGGKLDYSRIRLFGLSLLLIGIVKLIFFDLSTLDLIVRSVLFIVIGGAGLLLTNKLLAKK